ncbi:MAG: DUF707 domain-containing protein [Bacteroidota bacterium]
MKNLIIAAVGDDSRHTEWLTGEVNFDICLIYYGGDIKKITAYQQQAAYFLSAKGQKYHLIKKFAEANPDVLAQYEYVWMPDDDVSIDAKGINRLFQIAKEKQLWLCQPAMIGYHSHAFTRPRLFSFLRFTNFVEVLAPLMSIDTLLFLKDTFALNESAWGLEFLWNHKLNTPKNRIAIIDKIKMRHTKPVGREYSRFSMHPIEELKIINDRFNLQLNLNDLKKSFKTYKVIYGF